MSNSLDAWTMSSYDLLLCCAILVGLSVDTYMYVNAVWHLRHLWPS